MTKILLVDDEPAQARALSRAILLRRPDYSVLTASSGRAAIELLEEQNVDLVLTDLQMPELDGFDLIAWLMSNRPNVLTFAMTAYAGDEVVSRLAGLGGVECFNKPLEVDALLARLGEMLAQSIRGHVDNVGLASFLQLIELERKTCTLEVHHDHHVGELYLRRGELVDARTQQLKGEEAALAILGWLNVSLTIESSCATADRTIWKPAYHVVMEAMRLRDEATRVNGKRGPRTTVPPPTDGFPVRQTSEQLTILSERDSTPRDSSAPRRALGLLQAPVGALALAVIERATGIVLASDDRAQLNVLELARGAHSIMRQQDNTLAKSSDSGEAVEELVMVAGARCELIRPLPSGKEFVLLVFDSNETNLVMARHELNLFVKEYARVVES